jgi:hypothetical protein
VTSVDYKPSLDLEEKFDFCILSCVGHCSLWYARSGTSFIAVHLVLAVRIWSFAIFSFAQDSLVWAASLAIRERFCLLCFILSRVLSVLVRLSTRDGNLGRMAIWVRVPDPTGTSTKMIFYLRVAPIPDPNQDGYFFPPVDNLTGTRYFTTVIILGCEQVKICSFCYMNYDLFWLLNFATLLSQIFVEY